MADSSYLQTVLGWLRGEQPQKSHVTFAPALSSYPSDNDAENARQYGFGYGTGNEPYLNNERARVIGSYFPSHVPNNSGKKIFLSDSALGMKAVDAAGLGNTAPMIDVNDRGNSFTQAMLRNTIMKAGLASNRSPIASVGFDPSKVALDTMIGVVGQPVLRGVYAPGTDSMYSIVPHDAITHESTHRGLQQLRKAYPEAMGTLESGLPSNEELTVRYLMRTRAGDPEASGGPTDKEQRDQGTAAYNLPFGIGEQRQKDLNQIEGLAALYNKEKRPGGPR